MKISCEKQIMDNMSVLGIDCFMPENGETSVIKTKHNIPLDTSLNLLKRQLVPAEGNSTYIKTLHCGNHEFVNICPYKLLHIFVINFTQVLIKSYAICTCTIFHKFVYFSVS